MESLIYIKDFPLTQSAYKIKVEHSKTRRYQN